MKREKGSITLFSLMSLLLITATIFALLEGTRLQEMRRFAELQTELAIEAAFASYNTCLWQNYHLLGTDKALASEHMERIANGRRGNGTNLLRLLPEQIEMKRFTRFTDGGGDVFIHNVSEYMQQNLLYETAKEVYNQYEALKYLMDSSAMDETNIGEALKEIEKAKQEDLTNSIGTTAKKDTRKKTDAASILEAAKSWQELGILELVIEDVDKLSTAKQDFSSGLLKRKLEVGNNFVDYSIDWKDRVLLQQYLRTYMSNFHEVQNHRAVSYELEYLLGEKSSDVENLKVVANKLLAVREAANFVYLLSNPQKAAQAEGLAAIITGATLNPILLEVVKIGLLTAWALAESILDVRALLAGKRIALLKSEKTWTVELENLGEITQGFGMAKECTGGLSYEDYLGVFLLLENHQKLAMRAMNVQEATIRSEYQEPAFRMDTLITQADVTIVYSYQPVFPFLHVIDAEERWEYTVIANKKYGYY